MDVEVPRRRFDLSGDISGPHRLCCEGGGLELAMRVTKGPSGGAAVFETCGVYVMQAEGFNYSKVGISSNPLHRIRQMQTSNFAKLRYRGMLWFDNWDAAGTVEQLVFKAADEMGIRGRGEWLTTDSAEAFDLVLKAARYAGLPCRDSATHFEDLEKGARIVLSFDER